MSAPKPIPSPTDAVISPSTSEGSIVIGALKLANPFNCGLAPDHLKLVLDVLDDLQETVQRNRGCKLIY